MLERIQRMAELRIPGATQTDVYTISEHYSFITTSCFQRKNTAAKAELRLRELKSLKIRLYRRSSIYQELPHQRQITCLRS